MDLSSLNGTNGFVLRGIDPGDISGHSVSSAGDVNGDGFDDLIIGAHFANQPGGYDIGESYVVFGQEGGFDAALDLSSLNGANGFVLRGIDPYDRSGISVSSAGDVNGDGFDDLIIGADRARQGTGFGHGESYVVFGGNFTGAVTHQGNAKSNTLNGDAAANVIIGGRGGDTLVGNGGGDVLRGGQGDDVLAIGHGSFNRIVGGNGTDTLRLDTTGLTLDLTTLPDNRLVDIEVIDITGLGPNTLTLDVREVLNISSHSNTLTVLGDNDDTLNMGPGWTVAGLESFNGQPLAVFTQGTATLRASAPLVGLITRTIDTDRRDATFPDKDLFTDPEGDAVTVKLSGTGQALLGFLPSGQGEQFVGVLLSNTNPLKTKLSVTARAEFEVGNIGGSGVRDVSLRGGSIVGLGINVDGAPQKITLLDLDGSLTFGNNVPANAKLQVTARNVGDLDLNFPGNLTKFTANSVTSGQWNIVGATGSVTTKAGGFGASLVTTSLAKLTVTGGDITGDGDDIFQPGGFFKSAKIAGRVIGNGSPRLVADVGLTINQFGFTAERLAGTWSIASQRAKHAGALPLVAISGNVRNLSPLTDFTGLYAFQSPTNANNSVLIATLYSSVTDTAGFAKIVSYALNVDNNGDAVQDLSFNVVFGGRGKVTLTQGGTRLVSGAVNQDLPLPGGGTFRAGRFDNPYFIDQTFIESDLTTASGVDTFAGGNVLALVLELPSASLLSGTGNSNIGVWATALSGKAQVDRMGRPLIEDLLIPDALQQTFRFGQPGNDQARFVFEVSDQLQAAPFNRTFGKGKGQA